ncbi:MAG: recombination regulator RecX [Rhodocyclaceae bacterium]|nr:recombination regulator RecX [Rhodocyclaceae bacterium]
MKKQDRTLKQRAVAYLARREHSRAELAKKLSAHGTQEEIDSVLNSLQDAKLLSDQRFAAAFVRSRAERFGAGRLRQELRQRGVEDGLVEQELRVDDLPSEIERARVVWKKKFDVQPADAKEWAKQARFLQGRGFGSDVIRRVLKEADEMRDGIQ